MTYQGRKRPFPPDEPPSDRPAPSVEDWFARNISGAGFWEWYVDLVKVGDKETGISPNCGREQDKPRVK